MSEKQILFTARVDGKAGPPFPETLLAFEDPGVDRLSFWVVGTSGYPAEACLAFVEFVEQLRSKKGKPCHTHLAAGATMQDLFLWLCCGIDGRTMRSTASFEILLPDWCRFSEVQCGREAMQEAERNLDLMEMLERPSSPTTIYTAKSEKINCPANIIPTWGGSTRRSRFWMHWPKMANCTTGGFASVLREQLRSIFPVEKLSDGFRDEVKSGREPWGHAPCLQILGISKTGRNSIV